MLSEEVKKKREQFIQDLVEANYTSYIVITHPKYSAKSAFRFSESPVSMASPYSWKYKDAKKRLLELGEILTPEEAERRNINFANPSLKKDIPGATLPTLRGGIQLLKPGEKAYTHRHTANAFRFILEAPVQGAYTVVEGTKIPMLPGDLILTPNWVWHDHHNEGSSNAIWFDGLDAIVAFWIGAGFYQEFDEVSKEAYQPVLQDADYISNNYGAGLLPEKTILPDHIPKIDNPLLYYPYSAVRKSLMNLANSSATNDRLVLHYVNPTTGKSTIPSMATRIRLVRANGDSGWFRRTENVVYITMEGNLTFELKNGQKFETEPYDVTAIPSWTEYHVVNTSGKPAIYFAYSDRPIFEYLGLFREDRKANM